MNASGSVVNRHAFFGRVGNLISAVQIPKPRATYSFAIRGRMQSARMDAASLCSRIVHSREKCRFNPCTVCLTKNFQNCEICVLEVNRSHSEVAYDIAKAFSEIGMRVCLVLNALVLRERGLPSKLATEDNVHVMFLPRSRFRQVVKRINDRNTVTVSASSLDYWRRNNPLGEGILKKLDSSVKVVAVRHSSSEAGFGRRFHVDELLMERWPQGAALTGTVYRPTFPNAPKELPKTWRSVVAVGAVGQEFESLIRVSSSLGVIVHVVGPVSLRHRRLLKTYGHLSQFVLHGPLRDDEMYRLILASGYVLGPTSAADYLGVRVSGARQLSFGLVRPLIVNPTLAAEWGLPDGSYLPAVDIAAALTDVARDDFHSYARRIDVLAEHQKAVRKQNIGTIRSLATE